MEIPQENKNSKNINAGLNHAFDEFVDGFAAVACFAACTERVLDLTLVTFAWRMQFKACFDVWQVFVCNFAVDDGVCEFIDGFVACFFYVFSEFFVA